MTVDLLSNEKNYLSTHLIAYIGNKRRLLPLLYEAFSKIPIQKGGLFVDYFAGTGVVSRLAKAMGYKVFCNDWEDYSACLNRAFVQENQSFVENFRKNKGLDTILAFLNEHSSNYKEEWAYVSKFYCPQDDQNPDVVRERMFYTRENGIRIDNIRMYIEEFYANSVISAAEKNFLLALLLVEASVRSNTSGVFKGFHQGFGGKKKDALGRILHPVILKKPELSRSTQECEIFCQDATSFAQHMFKSNQHAHIAYLDPPYNQHQYGSNYHMLNTIYRNDRPSLEQNFWVQGKKVNKSGIRKDWIQTRSEYCKKEKAITEFTTLVEWIQSDYIVVSYSTDGIIEESSLLDILSTKGKLHVITKEYPKFRGRRQRNLSGANSIEFIVVVDTKKNSSQNSFFSARAFLEIESKKIQQFCEKIILPKSPRDIFFDIQGNFFWRVRENCIIPLTDRLCVPLLWLQKNKQHLLENIQPPRELKDEILWILYVIRNFFITQVDKEFFLQNLINLICKIPCKEQSDFRSLVLQEAKDLHKNFLIFDKYPKLYQKLCKVMETQLVA